MTAEKTLRDQLEEAYAEATDPKDPADVVEEIETPEPEKVADVVAEPTAEVEAAVAEPSAPVVDAPQSWTGPMKEKWSTLPPDVQAEINRRENDFHKIMTSRDSELNLGKQMKDVITPYMPIITAEGGTPATAVQSLLDTAYQLRTGTPEKKAQLIHQIAQQYGVDLGAMQSQPQDENQLFRSMQNEIAQLKQQLNPEVMFNQLNERSENARIQTEIQVFAANPANKHFEQVKPLMGPLLASGDAETLQEAYDTACWAIPSLRSTLMQSQDSEREAKKKAEIASKKNAAVSIKGSPSAASGNAKPTDRSLREELAANMAAISSSKI